MRSIPVCLALVLYSAHLAAQRPQHEVAPRAYSILYTGRLLGYASIPDEQTFNVRYNDPQPNSVAQQYLDLHQQAAAAELGQAVSSAGHGR